MMRRDRTIVCATLLCLGTGGGCGPAADRGPVAERETVGGKAGADTVAVLVGAADIADCGSHGDDAAAALLDDIAGTVFTAGVYAAIALTAVACYVTLAAATRLERRLGQTGMRILTRLMGLVLCAIAVQFIIDGIKMAGLQRDDRRGRLRRRVPWQVAAPESVKDPTAGTNAHA